MAEEIEHYKVPIATIPPQSLLAAELHLLRRKRKRLRKEEAVKENERQQGIVKDRLIAIGREDLTR